MKVFPAQVAPPFGLTIMDLPERLPLPSKIVIRVLPKIDLRDRLGKSPNADDAYEVVTGTMQRGLDGLDEERRLAVVG